MMIKLRLKELDIKITELANYLQISRPTMYKLIELYDEGRYSTINKKIKKMFDYIEANSLIDKKNVINYILNNLVEMDDFEDSDLEKKIKKIKKFISDNPDSLKTNFICKCIETKQFDLVIQYLMEISTLIKKKKITAEEMEIIAPYNKIISYMIKKKENE